MTDEIDYLDQPPQPGRPVTEIHVWIGTHEDGGQGIVSADMHFPVTDGSRAVRHMPLLSSRRDIAESLAPLARDAQRAAMDQADRLVRLELRTFRLLSEGAGDGLAEG